MAKPTVVVTYADGRSVTARMTPLAEVRTERFYKVGIGEMQKTGHMEYLYYMGWATLNQLGEEKRQFEDFLNDIADVDFNEDEREDVDDPTSKAPLPVESSESA